MLADAKYVNATVFTSDKANPQATAFAVKDGKFIYVGDAAGLEAYEGETIDLGGKFVMPAILDSHIHISMPIIYDYIPESKYIFPATKAEALQMVADEIAANPGQDRYNFTMQLSALQGQRLTCHDLDAVCSTSKIAIQESEGHSYWVNSVVLDWMGITDETPDISPNLSYYVRDEEGHITGNMYELAWMPLFLAPSDSISDEQIEASLQKWISYCKKMGISAVFEAGLPNGPAFHERMMKVMNDMDARGQLPIFIDNSNNCADPAKVDEQLDLLLTWRDNLESEHLENRTFKLMMDGTLNIRTASVIDPYLDTNTVGGRLLEPQQIADLLVKLNEHNLNLHCHTVGEGAVKSVLDGVEMAKERLGEDFHVRVTCAHDEIVREEELLRFAKLGVFANFTPAWHNGNCMSGGMPVALSFLGETRAKNSYRCRTVWDSGATVCWSSDNICFGDFRMWNPYLGMKVGATRIMTDAELAPEGCALPDQWPSADECMTMEQMLLGYTINNAHQLRLEDRKGSIEAGKDADFLVFENNLLEAELEGFSHTLPQEVFFQGVKMN